jgi:hypothetical protein
VPSSCNDINIPQWAALFTKLANGESPSVEFQADGRTYNMGYYLVDNVYPKWVTFVKALQNPHEKKELQFRNAQSEVRKDVERAFGTLQPNLGLTNQFAHHD